MQGAEFLQGQLRNKRDKRSEEEGQKKIKQGSSYEGSLKGGEGQYRSHGNRVQSPLGDTENLLLLTSCLGRSLPNNRTACNGMEQEVLRPHQVPN